jgi:hypothetical protein
MRGEGDGRMNISEIKIYHIVHVDRLPSIISSSGLFSDADARNRRLGGTTIGMSKIKQRRLEELTLASHLGLHVGECVPFYFCPRSVMLYMLYRMNHPDINYRNGQEPIIHLEASLIDAVNWANSQGVRWAFTSSNAGSYYFEDFSDLRNLDMIDWDVVNATQWQEHRDKKQAEFLIEKFFPWSLFSGIGVYSDIYCQRVNSELVNAQHKPVVAVKRCWYY